METVKFLSTETEDDLIVSFAVQDPRDPAGVESLTLIRTPKYEFVFDDEERGVHVSFERDDSASDEDDYLEQLQFDEPKGRVRLKTTTRRYELDVRKVDANELKAMRKVFRKMNFDGRIKMTGV